MTSEVLSTDGGPDKFHVPTHPDEEACFRLQAALAELEGIHLYRKDDLARDVEVGTNRIRKGYERLRERILREGLK